mmetsp:Transcript_30260/g.56524  ORF Transcript_30260/g.56524 Transcript_30260/m.56524 type:complete len:279 (+) Transcript_30260:394-1230(+)
MERGVRAAIHRREAEWRGRLGGVLLGEGGHDRLGFGLVFFRGLGGEEGYGADGGALGAQSIKLILGADGMHLLARLRSLLASSLALDLLFLLGSSDGLRGHHLNACGLDQPCTDTRHVQLSIICRKSISLAEGDDRRVFALEWFGGLVHHCKLYISLELGGESTPEVGNRALVRKQQGSGCSTRILGLIQPLLSLGLFLDLLHVTTRHESLGETDKGTRGAARLVVTGLLRQTLLEELDRRVSLDAVLLCKLLLNCGIHGTEFNHASHLQRGLFPVGR